MAAYLGKTDEIKKDQYDNSLVSFGICINHSLLAALHW